MAFTKHTTAMVLSSSVHRKLTWLELDCNLVSSSTAALLCCMGSKQRFLHCCWGYQTTGVSTWTQRTFVAPVPCKMDMVSYLTRFKATICLFNSRHLAGHTKQKKNIILASRSTYLHTTMLFLCIVSLRKYDYLLMRLLLLCWFFFLLQKNHAKYEFHFKCMIS